MAEERSLQMKINKNSVPDSQKEPREGDVYAIVDVFGRQFELKYGYYDDMDRAGPPDIIYPDFIKSPIYTDTGEPLVTMMQDACPHYKSSAKRTDDATCGECKFFNRDKEWFGLCRSKKNRKNERSNE